MYAGLELIGDNTSLNDLRNKRLGSNSLRDSNNLFNKVYKVVNVGTDSIGRKGFFSGSVFHYKNKKDKSFYVGAEHCFNIKDFVIHQTLLFDYLNKEVGDVRIEHSDKKFDLAVLSGDKKAGSRVKTVDIENMIIGHDVYLVGYPMTKWRCVSKTNVSSLLVDDGVKYIICDRASFKGFSGGAMIYNNRFAGHISKVNNDMGITLGISVDNYKKVLRSI